MTSALSDSRSRMSTYCNFMSYVILTLMLTCIPLTISVLRAPDTQMRLSNTRSSVFADAAGVGRRRHLCDRSAGGALCRADCPVRCFDHLFTERSADAAEWGAVYGRIARLCADDRLLISGHRKREKTEETVSALSNLLGCPSASWAVPSCRSSCFRRRCSSSLPLRRRTGSYGSAISWAAV